MKILLLLFTFIFFSCDNFTEPQDCAGLEGGSNICGCTEETACNYDLSATYNDGSCEYAEEYYDCAGACILDLDEDGVCDNVEILGCIDETAFNYDNTATEDDQRCTYLEKIYVSVQGFDQVNILNSIDGVIQDEQEIISVNFMEGMMDTPHFVEIDNENGYWFVTLINSGKVVMYSLTTNEMLSELMVGDSPALMVHNSLQQKLYISRMMPMNGMMGMPEAESNIIQVLDYSSGTLLNSTEFNLPGPAPHGLDLSDDGMNLFVASNTSDWVFKINTETGEILNSINLLDPSLEIPDEAVEINYYKPIQLKYFDNRIFITCSSGKFYNGSTEEDIPGKIMMLSANDLSIITSYEFEWYSTPWHLAIDEITNEMFIALSGDMSNMGSAGIANLSIQDSLIIENWISTGDDFSSCHGIAVSSISDQIYLSGRGNGILHSINRSDGSITQAIEINSMMDNMMMGAMLGGIAVNN